MVAAGSMVAGGNGAPRILSAHKSVERFGLIVRLDPGAHIERAAVYDVALEDRFVGDQDLRAAVGKDAAHFAERELRVQRNGDAAGADDGQEPVKAVAVVGAIDRDRLAGAQADGAAKKGIDRADCRRADRQDGRLHRRSTETSQSPLRRSSSSTRLATVMLRSRAS